MPLACFYFSGISTYSANTINTAILLISVVTLIMRTDEPIKIPTQSQRNLYPMPNGRLMCLTNNSNLCKPEIHEIVYHFC